MARLAIRCGTKSHITAVSFLIGGMTISGIPPTVGFVSKMMIFMGAFGPGIHEISAELILVLVAILATALTVAYTMWTMRRIFYGPIPDYLENVKEASSLMTIPMIVLCVISVILGVYPTPILDPLIKLLGALIN